MDLDDLPQDVRDSMKFVLAERVEQVWDTALMPVKKRRSPAVAAAPARSRNGRRPVIKRGS